MKNGTAITIVRSSNGFIVYEQGEIAIPGEPEKIATFADLDGGYVHEANTLIPFIKKHFAERWPKEPFTKITTMEVPNAE
jgi:hypothetical protein